MFVYYLEQSVLHMKTAAGVESSAPRNCKSGATQNKNVLPSPFNRNSSVLLAVSNKHCVHHRR
jgi:hypothetical protein